FRVVVTAAGVEHVSHRLYIQWLESDAKNHRYALLDTVNVKELDFGSGWVLETKTEFGDINALKIDVTARGRGGGARRFTITAMAGGKYRMRTQ
ncbi:MAG: hypothetical protein ACR2PI_01025, partial [Hyphomicrobiaceae bacterium]